MSNIQTNTIDITFPVVGQDNDSKGFRDNFAAIQTALEQAKTELELFESHSVLKTPLSGTGHATNDLALGSIINGSYNKFYGTAHSIINTISTLDVSLYNGIFQSISLQQNTTITLSHWPTSGSYATIRMHITAADSITNELSATFAISNGGSIMFEASFPSIAIRNDSFHAIEAWSMDGGVTVFFRYLGRFDKP